MLKAFFSGNSINFLDDISESFTVMFPDSKIASQMRLKLLPDVANFGIAHHFVSVLNDEISKSVIYSLSFDESLDKTTQECEMDLLVRFWDETYNDVKMRYLGSTFFGHATAKDSKQ